MDEKDGKIEKIAKGLCKNSQRAIKEAKFLIQQAVYSNPRGFLQEEIIFGEDFAFHEPRDTLTIALEQIREKISKQSKQ